jgi:hypothetical protein
MSEVIAYFIGFLTPIAFLVAISLYERTRRRRLCRIKGHLFLGGISCVCCGKRKEVLL